MKSYTITSTASGQRIDRYLMKLLPKAGKGFLQKMLRKKNIKLNSKKASPSDLLKDGDVVEIFFSDETFNKFSDKAPFEKEVPKALLSLFESPVYSNDDFLAVNKPAGVLTQPDITKDPALSDAAVAVIGKDGTFSPAPLTRLDRGTTGIVIFPKNYQAQKRALSAIRKKSEEDSLTKKYYLALVHGEIRTPGKLEGAIQKDDNNRVSLTDKGKKAELFYEPLLTGNGYTLLRVDLRTGRTHQIRAQLEKNQTPIVGDQKYGDRKINQFWHLDHQLLHAAEYVLKDEEGLLLDVRAPLPKDFKDILEKIFSAQDLERFNQENGLL